MPSGTPAPDDTARLAPGADRTLAARLEDAGLDASAPPVQRWLDGWLLRSWPGKARRARCVNALGPGVLPLDERLALAEARCAADGVPLVLRITPFTQPPTLDADLAARGFVRRDPTWVMQRPLGSPTAPSPSPACPPPPPPAGLRLQACDAHRFAAEVGLLRGSSPRDIESHAGRLAALPLPMRTLRLADGEDRPVAAALAVADPPFVGLYDVVTAPAWRRQGLAHHLCERLLSSFASAGVTLAYLQVDAANTPALALYRGMGFEPVYGYHYRERPAEP